MTEPSKPALDLSFEEALRRLEDIVTRLEAGEATLEESLGLFEEGVTAARRCQDLLRDAEKRVTMLVGDEEGLEVDFETGELVEDEGDQSAALDDEDGFEDEDD
jgi:exodeoxyribonuclease VII small subunit